MKSGCPGFTQLPSSTLFRLLHTGQFPRMCVVLLEHFIQSLWCFLKIICLHIFHLWFYNLFRLLYYGFYVIIKHSYFFNLLDNLHCPTLHVTRETSLILNVTFLYWQISWNHPNVLRLTNRGQYHTMFCFISISFPIVQRREFLHWPNQLKP